SSPSTVTVAEVPAATPGMNRITVPARPASTVMLPVVLGWLIGVISKMVGSWLTRSNVAPRAVNASTISSVSRETRTPDNRVLCVERAASTKCRLVNDLEPGSATVASTGVVVNGADQALPGTGVIVANRTSFQCVQRYIPHLLRYLVIAVGVADEPALRGIIC